MLREERPGILWELQLVNAVFVNSNISNDDCHYFALGLRVYRTQKMADLEHNFDHT
jgi:hypothetical protein